MKRSLTIFISSLLGMMSIAAAQDTLKIMTYNLEGMKPGTDPATRIFYAIQDLKKLNPDIIGVQEVNENLNGSDNQAKAIADSLSAYFGIPYYTYLGFTHQSWSNTFNEYVGIITKYPVGQSDYLSLVKGAFPRKVLWNHINTPLGTVNFFNTHLDYLSTDIRIQQIQQIIGFVAQKDSSVPAIASLLTGDFNDKPDTAPILLLTNSGTGPWFIDTYRAINPPLQQGYTIPATAPSSRIDFIFYKNTGQLTILSSKVVMDDPYTGISYPSDHWGVMTIFTKNITEIGNDINQTQPESFELFQNFPNPFNPTTTISYTVPHTQHVTLRIYNSLGQLIRTLADEDQSEGFKSISWNGKNDSFADVAGGVYFIQMNSGEFHQTRKLLLIK